MRSRLAVVTSLISATCFLTVTPALANSCADVVDDTIAELRAGTAQQWTDEVESLVRSAAGSACVKARSARYGALATPAEADGTAGANATASGSSDNGASSEEVVANDDGSWSIGGLTFRGNNGSPAKKPYQRVRDNDNR